MKLDNQIKNPECERCKVKAQPGILIMGYKGFWLCGGCVHKTMIKEKEINKKLIFEE